MSLEKKVLLSELALFYGKLLTPYQLELLNQYNDLDNSLQEIADEHNITKQAVRDTINRASNQLMELESKLGLYSKLKEIIASLKGLRENITENNYKEEIIKEIDKLLKNMEE